MTSCSTSDGITRFSLGVLEHEGILPVGVHKGYFPSCVSRFQRLLLLRRPSLQNPAAAKPIITSSVTNKSKYPPVEADVGHKKNEFSNMHAKEVTMYS